MSRWIPRQVLLISKLSNLEYLKQRSPNLKERQILEQLRKQGKDPNKILHQHGTQISFENKVIKVLKKFKINFRFTKRMTDASKHIHWADFVIPIGGDGTFTLASKLVNNNLIPVMGINPTSFHQSNLTLPVQYTENVENAFEKLFSGAYKLIMRSRIRIVMYGKGLYSRPFHVNEKTCAQERRINALIRSAERKVADALQPQIRILPWLALNEVFLGEFAAAKVSTMIIQVDDNPQEYRFRSSGICICTGSGSRSWFRAMNFQGRETIQTIVSLATNAFQLDDKSADLLTQKYRNLYVFDPEENRIAYKIRNLYQASSWPKPKDLPDIQICKKVLIKSLSFDAGLVVDCSVCLPFNHGTKAVLEVRPEDALKTIVLI